MAGPAADSRGKEVETIKPISCGIAGWSYPDWNGYVYPPGGTRDPLRYLAPYVDMIEINSTFYRPPAARQAASWAERVAELPDFFFAAKLHQEITHQGLLTPEMSAQFHEGLAPLAAAGRLRHLLAQFRYDFADTEATRGQLQHIRDQFSDLTNLVLELRHNSWQGPEALQFLSGLGVTVANLDYPLAGNSFNLPVTGIGQHAYLRLHGRNRVAWFDKKAGRDQTYNYLYNKGELESIFERARQITARSGSLTVVANNHYQGKEVVNALQLKAMFAGRKVMVPPILAEKYPDLKAIATPPAEAGGGRLNL